MIRMYPEYRKNGDAEDVKTELGSYTCFFTENITPLQRNAAEEFYGYQDKIDGYEVTNHPQVNLKYGLEMTQGTLELITCDGKLCVVYLPEYRKTAAALFSDFQSWNPTLRLPRRISSKEFSETLCIYSFSRHASRCVWWRYRSR